MKYVVKISNLSFEIEIQDQKELGEKVQEVISLAVADQLRSNSELAFALGNLPNELKDSKFITLEQFDYDWEKAIKYIQNSEVSIILLQDGKKYRIKEYTRQKIFKDFFIVSKGKAELVFGVDYFNQWDNSNRINQDKFIFDLGTWNANIGIINVDISNAPMVPEAQPFYRCLFTNSIEKGQSGCIGLINSKTDLEFGIIYSGNEDNPLTLIQKNIHFQGILWQELKANNGGGIQLVMDSCELKQLDPPVYFQKQFSFYQDRVVVGEGTFFQIETLFQGFGNSSNIVFVEGMTFLLPPKTFFINYHNRYNNDQIQEANFDQSHLIHRIPRKGDRFLMSRSYHTSGNIKPDMIRNVINWAKLQIPSQTNRVHELQAGDQVKIADQIYTIKIKDRLNGVDFASEYRFNDQDSYYSAEFKLDRPLPDHLSMIVPVEVVLSRAEKLLDGRPKNGYMIFKYNKHWQTNTEVDHGLEYMLTSNPFGVLSYNHQEISIWARNTSHNGFYRQSRSGIGQSKGYTLINCKGFQDEFNPGTPPKSGGKMPQTAFDFIKMMESIVREN